MNTEKKSNFLEQNIDQELSKGKISRVYTRFPPEPNGFLHIGHAKSICLNFGLAEKYQGQCNLRFDDTNPEKEEQRYVDAIQEDILWLDFHWHGSTRFSSDYFETLYQWAQELVRQNKAYVCDLSPEEMSRDRGWATTPGKESPYRTRTVAENLDFLTRMKQGEFADGSKTLRAKIDMSSPNMNLRDPVLYRISHKPHHKTAKKWCIYPSYDFAHGQSDAIEGITHSICTLEFQDHKALYYWFLEHLPVQHKPCQYEFARLQLSHTITSKRKLKQLVDNHWVNGWDDPRMPTISGMRRRGFTPKAIKNFCEMIGVTRSDSVVDISMLEHAVRSDLNDTSVRAMVVFDPVKIVLSNLDSSHLQIITASKHPSCTELGDREIPLTQEIYIDKADFTEDASLSRKKFKRLVLGDWVRLRHGYVIQAEKVIKNKNGDIEEIHAHAVLDSLNKDAPEGIKPRGVIHWVSAIHAKQIQLNLYDRLFNQACPGDIEDDNMKACVNKNSYQKVSALGEPALLNAQPEDRFQFEREGYFVADRYDYTSNTPVFNLTIRLRDNWNK